MFGGEKRVKGGRMRHKVWWNGERDDTSDPKLKQTGFEGLDRRKGSFILTAVYSVIHIMCFICNS